MCLAIALWDMSDITKFRDSEIILGSNDDLENPVLAQDELAFALFALVFLPPYSVL